ncbi:MAG: hypothetical protein Q9192_008078, partial [Flavoplaca navasiana]
MTSNPRLNNLYPTSPSTRTLLLYILLLTTLITPAAASPSQSPHLQKPNTALSPLHSTPHTNTKPSQRDLQPLAQHKPHPHSLTPRSPLLPTLHALTRLISLALFEIPTAFLTANLKHMHRKMASFIDALDAAYVPTPYLSFTLGAWELRIRSPVAMGWVGVK